jgi:hypothetical protein
MFMLMQAPPSDGLTLAEIIRDIPHDAGAIVAYVMILIFIGFIWLGSRRKPT